MTEEEKKRLGLTGQQPSRSQIVAPNTQAPAVPAAPAQPAAPAPATQPAAPAAATNDRYRTGVATRGEGGVSLEDQAKSMEGYELIGFKGNKPLYEKADSLYSSQVPKVTPAYSAPTPPKPDFGGLIPKQFSVSDVGNKPASSATISDFTKNPIPKISSYGAPEQPAKVTEPPKPSIGALREQYQKDATAARQEIEQKYKQPEQPKYFSKEYANQFMAAQESANQRAKERIAYGGQPVRDTSDSMAFANKAAAAMRAEAAKPKLAGKEYIETSGLDKATQKRLLWGVGENGEDLGNVTEDVVNDEMARRGITKKPGPTFQNPFSGASKPSNRLYRRPGL